MFVQVGVELQFRAQESVGSDAPIRTTPLLYPPTPISSLSLSLYVPSAHRGLSRYPIYADHSLQVCYTLDQGSL